MPDHKAGLTADGRPVLDATEMARVEELAGGLGRSLWALARKYRPSPEERLQDWLMFQMSKDMRLESRVLRFVDALAAMEFDVSGKHVQRLFREYFAGPFPGSPPVLRSVFSVARSRLLPAPVVRGLATAATRAMARRFIAGKGTRDLQKTLAFLEKQCRYPSFDLLGEQVLSADEALRYKDGYLETIDCLATHPWAGKRTRAGVPRLQVSVKASALTDNFNPVNPEGTLQRVRGPLLEIAEQCRARGVGLTIDAEEFEYRELTWRLFSRNFAAGPFGDWDGVGIAVQAYLQDAEDYVDSVIEFAEQRGVPFQVRLVKGAYWDYEVTVAREKGWPAPVFTDKSLTDLTYENLLGTLVRQHRLVRVAAASHNIRCHAYAEAIRESQGMPPGAIEHQTLFRTAEGISRAVTGMGWENREYVPVGKLVPGMAYLVRRVLENASQVGFLLRSRLGEDIADLLRPPQAPEPVPGQAEPVAKLWEFHNNPPSRLFLKPEREAFQSALASARTQWGREYVLEAGDRQFAPAEVWKSLSPSERDPARPAGLVHMAGPEQTDRALEVARQGMLQWSSTPAARRVEIIRSCAEMLRRRRGELASWVVHEGGRTWGEALADVDEAVDHLEYNAARLLSLQPYIEAHYRPRGVVAVIPPWNFPTALPMAMTSAALLAGNSVVLKSAEQTPVIASHLVRMMHEAGVPRECLVHLPGRGETVGSRLAESPAVDMIAFTGSKAVGTRLYQAASRVRIHSGLKKVIAEMGGKNAIVVFPDADIDEAVRGIMLSAFEHSGQKCSACSRVFVHKAILPRLRERLVGAASDAPIGLAEDPDTLLNPLIDEEARDRVLAYAARAREEGTVLLDRTRQASGTLLVGPLIVELDAVRLARSVVAQEEVFGPVLVVAPFEDEEQMLAAVNGTAYALTAGIFCRSPRRIREMSHRIRAGSIYVNRKITGARVGVEPFGGFHLSGTGPKAGGPDYLLSFLTRRQGYRDQPLGPVKANDPVPPLAQTISPWKDDVEKRVLVVRRAIALLGEDSVRAMTRLASLVVESAQELHGQQPTISVPGQHTYLDWETPRGVGLVATDSDASPDMFCGMIVGPLLAGNGLVLCPPPELRPMAATIVRALNSAGMPRDTVRLAPQGSAGQALLLCDDSFHFAVTDMGLEATRGILGRLAVTREDKGQTWLKALMSMQEGPQPGEPGFLRLFAHPKTVTIRTLRHGAELALPEGTMQ